MLTDNAVLVRNIKEQPALMCIQRKAEKIVPTEEDFVRANINSFGNDIGSITNHATSMYEVRSHFEPGSKECKVLSYRIQCGQLFQQEAIDKAKGIVSKPMPRSWYDRHTVNKIEDDETRRFYRSIIADRKPYFMRYIYPALMKQYNTYIRNTNRNALREFRMTVDEMRALPYNELNEKQRDFLRYYEYRMPVGTGDCVMNKICRRFEEEFDGYVGRHNAAMKFDYTIMKSTDKYTDAQFYAVKRLYENYNRELHSYMVFSGYERVDKDDASLELSLMNNEFQKECNKICPNESILCNILLDICYSKNATRRFVWSMCAHTIIRNLFAANNNMISFPTIDGSGEIYYCGNHYTLKTKEIDANGCQ